MLRINGLAVDGGASIIAASLLAKRMLVFGDSITAGEHVNTDGSDDATQSFAFLLARALGAELALIGYGGQGWTVVGGSNAPAFETFYATYSIGRARSFSGLDYVAVVHGTNDARAGVSGSTIQATAQTWLSAIRAACGSSTVIFVIVPPNSSYEPNLSAAVAAYRTASGDTKVYIIDGASLLPPGVFTLSFGGTTQWTYDGVHPLAYGHGRIGGVYSALAANVLASGGSSGGILRQGFSGGFDQ